MRASTGTVLLILIGCLSSAASQTKSDPCARLESDHEVQECHAKQHQDIGQNDAIAKKVASELLSAIQKGSGGTVAADSSQKTAGVSYDVHLSDCENRWVALFHESEDRDYIYGFVYIDPQAGFTLQYVGHFSIDADGNFHEAPNPAPPDKMNLKIRLEGRNGIAALLPSRALTQLALPEKPDWLKYYEDKAVPVTHKVSWGFFYNAIGDSRRAIDYLEPAYRENPDAPRVVFELTYAYNALDRPEDAIRIAKSTFEKNHKDELLCREMAFAYLHLKKYKEATEQYQSCIALCGDSDTTRPEKSELAMNLSSAYERMGDAKNSEAWRNKARDWAPEGSPVYMYFHQDQH